MNINALDNSFIPFPEWVDWTVVSEENHLPFWMICSALFHLYQYIIINES